MRIILLLFFSVIVAFLGNAQSSKLKAYIEQKSFYAPETGNYIELYFQFVGYTLKYKSVENGLKGKVMVSTTILNQKSDTVRKDIYVLESPLMRDSIIEDFYDAQRFALADGKYTANIELTDLNVENAPSMSGSIAITVIKDNNIVEVSDITIAEIAVPSNQNSPFVKSGYEIIPRLSNFYGKEQNMLPYYAEIYLKNDFQDSLIGVKQTLISSETKQEVMGFSRFTRMKTEKVIPVLRKIDITDLYTGSYTLKLEVIDRNNQLLGEPVTYSFERVNEKEFNENIAEVILDPSFQASITDDSLIFYIESLMPIAKQSQTKLILQISKSGDKEQMRKYFQQFWIATAGTEASSKWMEYKEQVLFVQKLYATNIMHGYEVDRGRVYLQYGPPNSILSRETSPSEYPYEIWVYNKIQVYSNKRFIFYNPDLVNNNYRLLHSDMRGELQNLRWQQALSKRNNPNQNPEDPKVQDNDHFGGNSNYYYRQY
jgi:GWxTD domain-containing protein